MTNTAPYVSGVANNVTAGAGADTALFLKMFAGEVLKTFKEKNMLLGMTRVKNVGAGRSHQFPVLGTANAAYHVRGENILDPANNYLNSPEQGERTIQVDKTLIAPFITDDWDQKLAHFGTRGEYAAKCGEALANQQDRQLFQLMALAARSGATLSATQAATKGGSVVSRGSLSGATPSAANMRSAMIEAATALVTKDVPMEALSIVCRPAMYYALIDEGALIDINFGNNGNGSQAGGAITKGYGFKIYHSNHIPSGVVAAQTGELNTYSGDFSNTEAVAFHGDAIGTVIREGITVETDRKPEVQGDLVIARMMVGHGILRPECAVEITNTP